MDMIVWLAAGAAIGWGASIVLGVQSREGLIVNILFGLVGAAAAGRTAVWLFSDPLTPTSGLSGLALVAAVLGALFAVVAKRFVQQYDAKPPPMARRPPRSRRR